MLTVQVSFWFHIKQTLYSLQLNIFRLYLINLIGTLPLQNIHFLLIILPYTVLHAHSKQTRFGQVLYFWDTHSQCIAGCSIFLGLEIKGNVLLSLFLVHQKCLLFFGYKNSFKYSIHNAFPFYFHVRSSCISLCYSHG